MTVCLSDLLIINKYNKIHIYIYVKSEIQITSEIVIVNISNAKDQTCSVQTILIRNHSYFNESRLCEASRAYEHLRSNQQQQIQDTFEIFMKTQMNQTRPHNYFEKSTKEMRTKKNISIVIEIGHETNIRRYLKEVRLLCWGTFFFSIQTSINSAPPHMKHCPYIQWSRAPNTSTFSFL